MKTSVYIFTEDWDFLAGAADPVPEWWNWSLRPTSLNQDHDDHPGREKGPDMSVTPVGTQWQPNSLSA